MSVVHDDQATAGSLTSSSPSRLSVMEPAWCMLSMETTTVHAASDKRINAAPKAFPCSGITLVRPELPRCPLIVKWKRAGTPSHATSISSSYVPLADACLISCMAKLHL